MIGCLFNPAGCISDGVANLLSLVPFGALGVVAIASLIIGAILGKWGVGALIAAIVAVKVGSIRSGNPIETELSEKDASLPFGTRPRTAKRTPVKRAKPKPYEPPESLVGD